MGIYYIAELRVTWLTNWWEGPGGWPWHPVVVAFFCEIAAIKIPTTDYTPYEAVIKRY